MIASVYARQLRFPLLVCLLVAACFVVEFHFRSPSKQSVVVHNVNLPVPHNFIPRARTNSSVDIAIVIIIKKSSSPSDYKTALNSLECYAALHGYRLLIDYDDKYDECGVHLDKFFRRHCHTHILMQKELREDSWLLFIDADNGIVNPERLIEDFIDPDYDIYLYNRFFNWEFAAQYLVKNNKRGRDWVKGWANFEFSLPMSLHGSDNGALHIVMMEYLAPESKSELGPQCRSIWERSSNNKEFFIMETCTRLVIGERTHFPEQRVKIFPKAKSWAQDLWLLHSHWSSDDFMLHGLKEKNFNKSSVEHYREQFAELARGLSETNSDILLPSPFNGKSACESVFPLLNKLDIAKCRNGTQEWSMDTRLKIDGSKRRYMLERMSDRILKQQIEAMGFSNDDEELLF